MAGGEAQHASLPEVRTWRGGAMEEMKRTTYKFQSKRLFEESSISKNPSNLFMPAFYVTSWFNVEVSFFWFFGFHMANTPLTPRREGLQLVVRKEELEQSTGEHSPGVSLPGNSGLLSTFQDICCFYHWNCSLDELVKWCGNCRNDGSSLWVLYLCCDRNKDPNYIIAVVNVLEDRKICLSGASTRNCSKFLTFKNITFRCLKCTFLCFFWGKIISRSNLLRVAVQSVSSMNWFRPHRTRCFCPAITWHEREKWQHRSLARDETGWMGVMGPMSETSISWWGYRIPVRIMNHDNYHDHVWSIWMLQNFHGRCFGVLNILGSLWIKNQNKEHWLSNV